MNPPVPLQPHQILCLECEGAVLFAELIQVAQVRNLLWVRPIALGRSPRSDPSCPEHPPRTPFNVPDELYNLRQSADLLLPSSLFRVAFDWEFLPLLPLVKAGETETEAEAFNPNRHLAQQEMRIFLNQLCQAYPAEFQR